ncbi:MAG: exosortase/archaeosortase family protein [Candidatus Bathyarchaeia archaeon]
MAPLESTREKPAFTHALIHGALAVCTALFLTSHYAWDLTARAAAGILNLAHVKTVYISPLSPMQVKLMDGTLACFHVLLECSGLVTVAIFSFIFTFTIGLLKGSLLNKIVWFLLSIGIGVLWNINRLAFVIIVAYNFGLSTFSFTHYLVGPFIDFLWVVSMWSLGMSWTRREERLA